jgi:glycerol-3-phosphate dehydrogenase
VREALLERQINVALAPHLVKPLPLIVPAFDGARPDRLVGLGLNMYDVMAVDRISPLGRRRDRNRDGVEDWSPARHRVISGEEVAELVPALAGRSPSGGYLFYDCQTDDARLVLTVLAEAERFGAVAVNGVEAVSLLEEGGRAAGARVCDAESGEELEVRAANVVNATGVWADQLRPEELHDEAEVPVIRPSRGTHIIVEGSTLPMVAGAIAPAGGGRTIFVLPWLGQTLIGTTDNDYEGELRHIQPGAEDVSYLLEATNAFFASSLGPGDVAGAYAGVRPLISTGDPKKSVDISRKAELYETSSGMVTITGGKLTTWRRMAKMTVDRIVEREGRDAPCRTDKVPLGMAVEAADLPHVPSVAAEAYEQLAGRYGYAAHEVLRMALEQPALAEPVVAGRVDLLAEAAYAARREQARTVGDVLLRRTRLGLTAARSVCADGAAAARRVAGAMAAERGWDDARCDAEAEAFAAEAAAEGIVVS